MAKSALLSSSAQTVRKASFYQRISLLGTRLVTIFAGRAMGQDQFGNHYFEARKPGIYGRTRRWVLYAGPADPSRVPPEWHGWLHHTLPSPLSERGLYHKSWQLPPQENLTGTTAAWHPPGSQANVQTGGHRAAATGDYQAWSPDGQQD